MLNAQTGKGEDIMKKLVAMSLIGCMALSMMACGSANETTAEPAAEETTTDAAEETTEDAAAEDTATEDAAADETAEAADTAADDKVWIIATDTVFRPFEFTDENGNFVGIDVDVLAAIAEDQGFKYELQSLGWDAAVAAVQAG